MPASGSCEITVNVTSAAANSYVNSTGAVATTNAGTSPAATGTLVVLGRVTVQKAFAPTSVVAGAASVLKITLGNPNAVALTGVAFSDAYPGGLVNTATPAGAISGAGCSGSVTAAADRLMRDAVAALVQWQRQVDGNGLPAYDDALLRRELALFPEWCVAREYGITWTGAQQATWDKLCNTLVASALAQPQVTVHRDWMPRNLMVTTPNPGILDFQDAVRGPVTYDIASLLRDAFLSWQEDQEIDWAARWWQQARAAGVLGEHVFATDFGDCWRAIEWMGLQRHLKILGIFCRLKHRDGKPAYAADLPRFFAYASKVALRYRELKPLIALIEPMTGSLTTTGFSMR